MVNYFKKIAQMTMSDKLDSSPEVLEKQSFEKALDSFLSGAQSIYDKYKDQHFPGQSRHFEKSEGPKFVKIIAVDENGSSRSVWAFIEKSTGNIFKAASYNAPAKNIRGNIFDQDNGLKNIGPYGPNYMKDMKSNYREFIKILANENQKENDKEHLDAIKSLNEVKDKIIDHTINDTNDKKVKEEATKLK